MSSVRLLRKVSMGTMKKKDATIAATILAKRFPHTAADLLAANLKKRKAA